MTTLLVNQHVQLFVETAQPAPPAPPVAFVPFPPGTTIRWGTSNPEVATVVGAGNQGQVTAKKAGQALVTCYIQLGGGNDPTKLVTFSESITVNQPNYWHMVAGDPMY
jgi:hypothetical protein